MTARTWEAVDDAGRVVWSGTVNEDGHLLIRLPERARKTRVVVAVRCDKATLGIPGQHLEPGGTLIVAPPTHLTTAVDPET